MQIELNTLISLGSALVVITSSIVVSKVMIGNIKESLTEFKIWTKEHIKSEKNHAMELANQRIGNIEADIDEMFPRLRTVEDSAKKNCLCLAQLQKDCNKRHREGV